MCKQQAPKTDTDLVSHRLPSDDSGAFLGGLAITTALGCMTLGPLVPGFLFVLAALGYYQICVTIAALLIASMILAQHSPRWCRFYLKAAGYFEKGVFLHFERRAVAATGESPSMWCMHPHGTAMGFGFSLNGAIRFRAECPEKFVHDELSARLGRSRMSKSDGVMAPVLFRVPLIRNMLLGFGCCTPATKKGILSLLEAKVDFGILPGGMEEVALYTKDRERVYLAKRAGFIKYALQHGYCLLPGYTFGESSMYDSLTTGSTTRMWMQENLGFIIPIFWGPYWFAPWLPRRDVALHTVIGSPLNLPRIENPTKEEVNKWHQTYISALTQLFETHKKSFGYEDHKLEIL